MRRRDGIARGLALREPESPGPDHDDGTTGLATVARPGGESGDPTGETAAVEGLRVVDDPLGVSGLVELLLESAGRRRLATEPRQVMVA